MLFMLPREARLLSRMLEGLRAAKPASQGKVAEVVSLILECESLVVGA